MRAAKIFITDLKELSLLEKASETYTKEIHGFMLSQGQNSQDQLVKALFFQNNNPY